MAIPSVAGYSAGLLVGLSAIGFLCMILRKKKAKCEYQKVGTVKKIILYPVKSLRGVPLETAEVTKLGFKYGRFMDRQWIIAKTDGGFITQRQEPSMALITVDIVDGELRLGAPDLPSISIKPRNKHNPGETKHQLEVFGQKVEGIDCGEEAANFIKAFLKRDDVRIAQFLLNFEPRKHLRNKFNFENPGNIIYHDDSAYNMLSEASVESLNKRLGDNDKVSHRNFRPSILVDDCPAHDEDNWYQAEIGTAKLSYMEPCTRCIFTTVNPETGIMNKHEPLRTLRGYRMSEDPSGSRYFGESHHSKRAMKSPRFGCYYSANTLGCISVGDTIFAVKH